MTLPASQKRRPPLSKPILEISAIMNVFKNAVEVSPDQLEALAVTWQFKGDQTAITKLHDACKPDLERFVAHVVKTFPHIDRDDVLQEARAGFVNGVRSYDRRSGKSFQQQVGAAVLNQMNALISREKSHPPLESMDWQIPDEKAQVTYLSRAEMGM